MFPAEPIQAGGWGTGAAAALLALIAVPAVASAQSGALVEILDTVGAVDGPSLGVDDQPLWERVRLELRIRNRLAQEIRDLEIELTLVSSPRGAATPIPGWSFGHTFSGPVTGPRQTVALRLVKPLPPRRSSPPADEIAFRVEVQSYRFRPPDLATAAELLGSPRHADQRAAVASFDRRAADTMTRNERGLVVREIARGLADRSASPNASDALRMLLAIRASGAMGLRRLLPITLALPERLDRATWGRAVIELARRMNAASDADEPRLAVLPAWAREQSALLEVRAEDALGDAVRSAILEMGDAAVPELLVQSRRAAAAGTRDRARRLLDRLGRATTRSQLQLRDTEARVRVIRTLGRFGSPEPVPALIELLRGDDEVVSVEAARALEDIGEPAIAALIDGLGEPADDKLLALLERLGRRRPQALRRAARAAGASGAGSVASVLERVRRLRRAARIVVRRQRVEGALTEGQAGRYAAAFAELNDVFASDPKVYAEYEERIARLYEARGRHLYVRGNYDAAVRTLKAGIDVHATGGALDLLADAQLALVYGFIELGDLQQAEEILDGIAPGRRAPEQVRLRTELFCAYARAALDAGNYPLARRHVDRALASRAVVPSETLLEADRLNRRLLIVENFAVVVMMGLLLVALALFALLQIRRWWLRWQLMRQVRALDRPSTPTEIF